MVLAKKGGETFIIDGSRAGERLDVVLAKLVPEISRTLWRKAIRAEMVLLDGRLARPSQKVLFGSQIRVLERPSQTELKLVSATEPEIIYQDNDVIVVDKPAGVITHPKPGKQEPSIAGTLAHLVEDDSSSRPGIVHRLDRDTSGVMIIARHLSAKRHLETIFRARRAQKLYWALVWGEFGIGVKRLGFALAPVGKGVGVMRVDPLGKSAETLVRQLSYGDNVSLVEAQPLTGRTHQIRVHLSAINHPILGDDTYGKHDKIPRQMLHACSLTLTLPSGKLQTFKAKTPADFLAIMKQYHCEYQINE